MLLIYDGDCGFCTKSANFGSKRLRNNVEIRPWQSIDDLSVYGLTEDDVQQRVYIVTDDNKVKGAARALMVFGSQMKFPWPIIALILSLPPFIYVAELIYKLVARYRHRMPGATDACVLPNGDVVTKKKFLGLYIFMNKSLETKLLKAVKIFEQRELSYKEIGATKGDFPKGYRSDHYSLTISNSKDDFEKAVKAFKSWVSHKGAGLTPSNPNPRFEPGETILFAMTLGPIALGFPDRIIYVEESDTEFLCAYGTIQGHPEKGEEFFQIKIEDDKVVFNIGCFSKIVATIPRIVYPLSRYTQKRVTKKYMRKLKEHLQTN